MARRRRSKRTHCLEVLLLLLIFVVFLLGATLVLLRSHVAARRQVKAKRVSEAALAALSKHDGTHKSSRRKTSKPFEPHALDDDVHLQRVASDPSSHYYLNRPGNRNATLREHYWRLAKSQLSSWDPNVGDSEATGDLLDGMLMVRGAGGTRAANAKGPASLRRAAELGHPEAQFYAAVAHWSGIWPVSYESANSSSSVASRSSTTTPTTVSGMLLHVLTSHAKQSASKTGTRPRKSGATETDKLRVMEEGWSAAHPQHAQALLYLHMAALSGHEEAIIAIANKIEHHQSALAASSQDSASAASSSSASLSACQMRLPYAEAASDVIIDRLQASPQAGRGKVAPPTDRHVLYQLHLHGSSSGSNKYLEQHNQPDETHAALQFYQVRANSRDDPSAAPAAYTLGHLYHTGARGVPVNLTLALHWYQVAADLGNFEAAGQAGDFYLYGYGAGEVGSAMPPGGDPYQAYKWYERGLPFAIETCRRRWEIKLAKKDTYVCDPTCLNGMGVLLMVGVPMMVAPDVALAEQYFELAKEQGKHDAAYNLAMVRLGWKSHWRTKEDAEDVEREYEAREERDRKKQFAGAKDSDGIFPALNQGMPKYSLTRSEWQAIVTDLSMAASAGHVQARHRLGKLYSTGVRIEIARSSGQSATEQVVVVPQDCEKAYKNFKWLMDSASLHRTRRLRRAYKQYVSGDLSSSLRNYLIAAETGSDLAQLNAAFLLEQGTCLGLSDVDCAKAAVRLYKSAAARGHAEASLRVGDFYYYGRFRDDGVPSGPFGWLQYILYPERYVGRLLEWFMDRYGRDLALKLQGLVELEEGASSKSDPGECSTEDGTCNWPDTESTKDSNATAANGEDDEHSVEHDMEMAAHYYRFAAEKAQSIRANFNLGFLYEWGLGLKQDFPLAKRHYDLAMSSPVPRVSDLPVAIALRCLVLHERALKMYRAFQEWKSEVDMAIALARLESLHNEASDEPDLLLDSNNIPRAAESKEAGRPVPPSAPAGAFAPGGRNPTLREQQLEIILKHVFSAESFLILILTSVLWVLMRHRTRRRR
jgi:TPR repeat protein